MITGMDFVWRPVADMARARAFYEGTLGLAAPASPGASWLEYDLGDGPAIDLVDPAASGGLMAAGPSAGVGFAARDFEGVTAAFAAKDLLHMQPFETDGCHGGPTEDPEGNGIVLHRRKAEPTRDKVIDFVVMPVAEMARARAFYEGELGLALGSEGRGIWAEYELADGSALALFQGPHFEAATGGGVGLRAPDLEDTFERLKAKGYARAEAVAETPVCHVGLVRDSEGNALVLHRRKEG